jgi:RNA polymerase sigma factor (sigma-70 family)
MQITAEAQQKVKEQELAQGLLAKDTTAFTQLYNTFSPVLYGLILRWVKDEGTAENILQDVFVKVWNSSSQYNPEKGRLFLWIYKISRNLSIDYLRSKAHRISQLSIHDTDLLQYLKKEHTGGFSPEYVGLRTIVGGILSKEENEIIELIYFNGYTQAEVAGIKAIPIGTVKTRCSRAIKRLRNFFKQDAAAGQSFVLAY